MELEADEAIAGGRVMMTNDVENFLDDLYS
jgi:hypothetical protein